VPLYATSLRNTWCDPSRSDLILVLELAGALVLPEHPAVQVHPCALPDNEESATAIPHIHGAVERIGGNGVIALRHDEPISTLERPAYQSRRDSGCLHGRVASCSMSGHSYEAPEIRTLSEEDVLATRDI
jgi:hypothetical protein